MVGNTEKPQLTLGRMAFGIALIIVVIIIWDASLRASLELPLAFLVYFVSFAAIMLGWAKLTCFPVRRLSKYLVLIGLWLFLFLLPILLLPLPPEIPPIVVSFSALLIVLIVGSYHKWKKKAVS